MIQQLDDDIASSLQSNQIDEPKESLPITDCPIDSQKNQLFITQHNGKLLVEQQPNHGYNIIRVKFSYDSLETDLKSFISRYITDKKYFFHTNYIVYHMLTRIVLQSFTNTAPKLIRSLKRVKLVFNKEDQ
ncbi:hypothetical protein QE152_g9299 [Popillia japonica]|uniref:Uncharacterized protein n=1 Tax=Popillia japonica TaxID=7064 RepID=A0AAW1LZV0_POPJA